LKHKHRKRRKSNEIDIPKPSSQITDHHHIIPRSRYGKTDKVNVVEINKEMHKKYHALFGNLLPDEIICYLVKEFWHNQSGWISKALLLWKTKRGEN